MSAQNPTLEDPLIAALPPNTDYITYLTILEYQLTPKNLPTLNRLLQEDDGTLASEIGWDLLKLVLPILRVEPSRAKECLDIISRRGNPREVIVRVSEELETLGTDETEDDAAPVDSDDGLPTFVGEAPRVHLGEMTLAGMPPSEKPPPSGEVREHQEEQEQNTPDAAVEELKLQSLISMLSLLHPRIKTQYPSRFLATSLPAALGAYRRLSMSADSTLAFLNMLTKLSGNSRPNLPPRVSTADMLKQTSEPPGSAPVASAPLPDPESRSNPVTESRVVAEREAAINQRLLQAVLLEIVEEHTVASSEAQPPLTAQLRMQHQPETMSSSRKKELDILTTSKEATSAYDVRNKFIAVSKSLKLDPQVQMLKTFDPPTDDAEAQEEHEYPTSPSQIPFPPTGLLLLYSTYRFVELNSQLPPAHPSPNSNIDTDKVLQLVHAQYTTDSRLNRSAPALDCILSLLYNIICVTPPQSSTGTEPPPRDADSERTLLKTLFVLKDIFITCPDPDLRDNAYHISTHILHAYLSPPARISIIKDMLDASTSVEAVASPIHEAQAGNLKAIAVNWLKDEIYPTQPTLAIMQTLPHTKGRGLPATILVDLANLLFPTELISEPPSTTTSTSNDAQQTEEKTEAFAADLPFYISSLNLLSLVAKSQDHDQTQTGATESARTDTNTTEDPLASSLDRPILEILLPTATLFLSKLQNWTTYLTTRLAQVEKDKPNTNPEHQVEGVGLPDVFALEDAVGRAKEALTEYIDA